jgi:AraC-like DNA-binding protein
MSEFIFIGIAHAIFTIIFIASKKNRPLSDNVLIIWIIFLALPLMTRALSPALLDIPIPLLDKKLAYPLCLGPFLWLYVKCVTGDIDKFKASYLWHFVPFLLVTLFQIMFQEPPIDAQIKRGNSTFGQLIWLANIGSLLCYSSVVLWRLQKHSKQVLNSFSSLTTQITLRWLTWLTCGFIIAYMLPLSARFTSLPLPFRSHGYALTGFIFILSFFGLKQTQVFTRGKEKIFEEQENIHALRDDNKSLTQNKIDLSEIEHEKNSDSDSEQSIQATNQNKKNKEKYQRSGLTQERALLYLKRIEEYTQTEKPYLDANLTVDKLANQSRIPRHYLTQIFSEQLNKNFYLYINEYRVNKVKLLLSDPNNKNMTLLDIAYESGFNSKSTFNTIFKKITKMTPSQYKNQFKNKLNK